MIRFISERYLYVSYSSSLDQLLHNVSWIELPIVLWVKVLEKLICLILSPLITRRHEKLLKVLTFYKPLIFLIDNFKGLSELLLNILFPQLLRDNEIDIIQGNTVLLPPILIRYSAILLQMLVKVFQLGIRHNLSN